MLLEDEAAHAEAIRRALKSSSNHFQVMLAGTLSEYHERVAAGPPDIALLDMVLPDGGAMELLASSQAANPFPLVIMTSHGDEQTAVEAMKAGALDYVVKSPQTFADMPRIVTHALDHWQLLQERKWGEEALQASEKKYRAVVEMANDVIIIIQDGIITFSNTRVTTMLGYDAGKIEGLDFVIFIPAEKLGPVLKRYHKRMAGEKLSEIYEMELLHKSGRTIPVETSGSLIEYAGKPADLVIIRDITERKRAEEALRESERSYSTLVENIPDMIVRFDTGLRHIFCNAAVEHLIGIRRDAFVGKKPMEIAGPDEQAQFVDKALRHVLETGEERQVERSFPTSSGIKIFQTRIVPEYNHRGSIESLLAISSDITDRKRLEEERQRVDKLESVGLLAGGIAHDFNNILTSILGNISLAKMDAAPGSELKNSLEQAEKASQRARALTVQLLTFSKGGAPVLKLAPLTELLKDTAGFALSGSKVKCRFSIPAGLWHAEIDAGQVSQVIHNLVINAQQAMPNGGSIEISAENMALSETQSLGRGLPLAAGDYIRIAVADHGCGIPVENLEKIFDPFFTTRQKGNGMGLAVSFSIARQHGGHLSVESEPGTGSTFFLYLPASTQTAVPEQATQGTVKPAGNIRILVMDDEQGVREIAGRLLKHIGYKDIEFAEDGAEAIKLYKAAIKSGNPFTVAILDLTIAGGMGGEIAIQKLLKIDPGVKAIVSSGYIDDPVIAKFKDHGFSGVMGKPYTIEELRKAVQDVISRPDRLPRPSASQ